MLSRFYCCKIVRYFTIKWNNDENEQFGELFELYELATSSGDIKCNISNVLKDIQSGYILDSVMSKPLAITRNRR